MSIKAWIRELEVSFTSSKLKQRLVFGTNARKGQDDLYISVQGKKYMSYLKDECTIEIKNLTSSEVVQLIEGEFYDVEVKAGYRSASMNTIFSGGVLYVSNRIDDKKSNTVIVLCASRVVAKYGQSRLNLTLNSGINLWSAARFICRRAGIPTTSINISTQLKKRFLQNKEHVNTDAASFLQNLANDNDTFIGNSDAVNNSIVSLFDAAKSNNRVIYLRSDNIILRQYPQLRNDGVELQVEPTFNFVCGDTVIIDNSIIQLPVYNKSDIAKNYGFYLDEDGAYMIYAMSYSLQNKGQDFYLSMLCRSRGLMSRLAEKL